MKTLKAQYREATEQEVKNLEVLAAQQLEEAGFEHPPEKAVQSRVKTLARDRGLSLPGVPEANGRSHSQISEYSPGLALVQGVCQQGAHQADLRTRVKRQGTCEVQGEGAVPYYFAALPDEYVDHFARYLPASAALVLWTLWRYSKAGMQTWVSQETLCEKSGLSENTVKRDLSLLRECNIVARACAGGRDFRGNEIKKRHGFKYHLTWPVAWDREIVKKLRWRKSTGSRDCG
jgi:hypothetical protein